MLVLEGAVLSTAPLHSEDGTRTQPQNMPGKAAGRKEQIRGHFFIKTLHTSSHIPMTYSILLNILYEQTGVVHSGNPAIVETFPEGRDGDIIPDSWPEELQNAETPSAVRYTYMSSSGPLCNGFF